MGLGFECAKQLLELGTSHLILAVRSQTKGDAAAEQLRTQFASAIIDVELLDMASPSSVRDFSRRCEHKLDRLDIVILNAGLSCPTTSARRRDGSRDDLSGQLPIHCAPVASHGAHPPSRCG